MNINILRYSLFGIAGGQEIDHTFVKLTIHPLTMIACYQKCLHLQQTIVLPLQILQYL